MKILITETQKRRILLETTNEELEKIVQENSKGFEKIVEEAQSQIGLNLKFLLTWGAGIGGFMGPIEDFVRGEFPELSEENVILILIGVISTYIFDNKKPLLKVYNKIQEDGLSQVFERVITKSDELKKTFEHFMESMGILFHSITNMMSYTFLIPIIPMIYQMTSDGIITNSDLDDITKRIVGFIGLTISGIIVRNIIAQMVKRFKGK
jgi:hypothetical protein